MHLVAEAAARDTSPDEQMQSAAAGLALSQVRDDVPAMAADLLFSDLFAHDRRSIAWLRVYRIETGEGVAVVVEPDDNPGASSVNAAESLIGDLRRAFGAPNGFACSSTLA